MRSLATLHALPGETRPAGRLERLGVAFAFAALVGCSGASDASAPRTPTAEARVTEAGAPSGSESSAPSACLGLGPGLCPGPGDEEPAAGDLNVLGEPLATCSLEPRTGYFRTGRCETGPEDRGIHVVCAQVTDAFLAHSREQGNDLVTPLPRYGFPGLRDGDRWCLCAARWAEALDAGVAPPVVPEATHRSALRYLRRESLLRAAVDDGSPDVL